MMKNTMYTLIHYTVLTVLGAAMLGASVVMTAVMYALLIHLVGKFLGFELPL